MKSHSKDLKWGGDMRRCTCAQQQELNRPAKDGCDMHALEGDTCACKGWL